MLSVLWRSTSGMTVCWHLGDGTELKSVNVDYRYVVHVGMYIFVLESYFSA